MTRKAWLIAGLALALIVLAWLCAGRHAQPMGNDLATKSRAALASAGFDQLQVSATGGRDLVISGLVANDADELRATEIVASIQGVRRIENLIEVAPPQPEPGLRIGVTKDEIVLTGAVPDTMIRDDLIELARQRFPSRVVVDDLTIDRSAAPESGRSGALMLESLDPKIAPGALDLSSEELIVTGQVADRERAEAYEIRLAELFAGTAVINRLEVAAQPALDEIIELDNVEFESSRARLTARGRQTLDAIAKVLARWPELTIEISGHTDSTGDPVFNRDLSLQRAKTAREYLGRTLDRGRFQVVGHGSDRPVASNETPEGRLANRRIEFRVIEEK